MCLSRGGSLIFICPPQPPFARSLRLLDATQRSVESSAGEMGGRVEGGGVAASAVAERVLEDSAKASVSAELAMIRKDKVG